MENVIVSKQAKISYNFKRMLEIVEKRDINVIVVEAGDKIQIDKYCYFDILFPQHEFISENVLNNNSIVTKFYMKNNASQDIFSLLLTGDIERIAEEKIVELYGNTNTLKSSILKVSHHGSKTSSTEQLLRLIRPKLALIRGGKR